MSGNLQTFRDNHGRFLPGSGGRPVGTLSLVGKVRKTCEELGFDWVVEAIKRFRDPSVPQSDRTQCLQMIADRVAPKLKAVEIRGDANASAQQVLINVIAGTQPEVDRIIPIMSSQPSLECDTTTDCSDDTV